MGARRRSDGGGGFAAVFVLFLVVGLIIKYFWWIAGAAALVGAFFAIRAIVRKAEQRRLAAAERDEELARRAEQQHRWTLRGDSRGVYGPAGAKAMRSVSPTPPELGTSDEATPTIATVVYTRRRPGEACQGEAAVLAAGGIRVSARAATRAAAGAPP
jgi:hypothetical protein